MASRAVVELTRFVLMSHAHGTLVVVSRFSPVRCLRHDRSKTRQVRIFNTISRASHFAALYDSLVAEGDPATCKIVWRQLHFDWVSDQNTNEIFANLSADCTQHGSSGVSNFNTKHSTGQPLCHNTFNLPCIVCSDVIVMPSVDSSDP